MSSPLQATVTPELFKYRPLKCFPVFVSSSVFSKCCRVCGSSVRFAIGEACTLWGSIPWTGRPSSTPILRWAPFSAFGLATSCSVEQEGNRYDLNAVVHHKYTTWHVMILEGTAKTLFCASFVVFAAGTVVRACVSVMRHASCVSYVARVIV